MKNDRREEFEDDFLLVHVAKAAYSKIDLLALRSDDYDLKTYSDPRLAATYDGWQLAKDAERKRFKAVEDTINASREKNPVMQFYPHIRTHTGILEAPHGFMWKVNFITANQWPDDATLQGGVTYSIHNGSNAEYVDVVLFQAEQNLDQFASIQAKGMFKRLSNAFHIKTHFEYPEGLLTHNLTRLTMHHSEFVELQNV